MGIEMVEDFLIIRIIHNEEVEALTMAIPEGHKHLRAAIATVGGDTIVLPEAVIAALVRGYVQIKTHPTLKALRMTTQFVENRKQDFATQQLLEVEARAELIQESMAKIIDVLGQQLKAV